VRLSVPAGAVSPRKDGADDRIRTGDLLITNQNWCPLSRLIVYDKPSE
jgi:hypothetical protein